MWYDIPMEKIIKYIKGNGLNTVLNQEQLPVIKPVSKSKQKILFQEIMDKLSNIPLEEIYDRKKIQKGMIESGYLVPVSFKGIKYLKDTFYPKMTWERFIKRMIWLER